MRLARDVRGGHLVGRSDEGGMPQVWMVGPGDRMSGAHDRESDHRSWTITGVGGHFEVECFCGWESTGHEDEESAENAKDEHLRGAS